MLRHPWPPVWAATCHRVAAAVPGARLVVQLDEPDIAAVLAGTIPTSSGYRTLRAVAGAGSHGVVAAWSSTPCGRPGPPKSSIAVPEIEAPFDRILAAGADGIAVPLKALTSRQWEQLAGAVEADKRLWAGALDVGKGTLPKVPDVVESVWRPWRQLGLAGVVPGHRAGHAVRRARRGSPRRRRRRC